MRRAIWIVLTLIIGLGLISGCESMTPVEPEAVSDDFLEPTDPWVELDLDEVLEQKLGITREEIEQIATEYGEPDSTTRGYYDVYNWWVIRYALNDYGRFTGENCKEWCRIVNHKVAGHDLPSTRSNGYQWYPANGNQKAFSVVEGSVIGGGTIEPQGRVTKRGHFVQFKYDSNKIHTAIFVGYSSTGFYVIDANWLKHYEDVGYVGIHHYPWDWWRSHVGCFYTVYQAY
ncbi:hypothetical protein KKI23_03215 [Patescibacteria group bacterium]|nr:hypothetical protein [Patescibacteria group bacterium]